MVAFSTTLTLKVVGKYFGFLFAAYLICLVYAPRALLLEVLNGTLVTVCSMVAVVYFPSVRSYFGRLFAGENPDLTGVLLMRMCIVGAWFWQMVQASGRFYFIEFLPEVRGRTFDATFGLPAVGYLLFASGHIIAIGMVDSTRVVRRNVSIVLWSFAAGVIGTLAVHFIHTFVNGGHA